MNIYANNTAAIYTTKLPKPIELQGEWVVSLKEISAPAAFDNVPHGYCSFSLKNVLNDEITEYFLEGGMYENKEKVLEELNRLANGHNVSFYLAGRRTRRVKVTVGKTHAYQPSLMLAHILGHSNYQWYGEGEYYAQAEMKLPPRMMITTLYVYCDVLEHIVVGDIHAPLLRVIDMRPNSRLEKMHKTFVSPLFVPLQKKSFETIEVNLMTDEGRPAPFSRGKSHVVLEFKRVGLLSGILYKNSSGEVGAKSGD